MTPDTPGTPAFLPPGAPPASTAPTGLATMGRGTLSRQLVLRTTALVAIIAVFLSGLTALAMHRILENQLDQQLMSTAGRVRDVGRGEGGGGPGQTQGLLIYWKGYGGTVQIDRDRQTVPDTLSAQLEAFPSTREPFNATLDGLGGYRVLVQTNERGNVIVTGLPTAQLTSSMVSILASAALLTILAIVIAYLAARTVVERSLRPLARLATTASQVAALELHSGEVAVPVRVAPSDTDARSEVGQVGLALNHMLDHVEDALAARQRSETKVRRFVADASHELRNPLASIRGYAELTRRSRAELPPDTQHALGRIDSESARMSHLVEDLLLLARLDSGPNLTLADADLTDIVVNAVSDAQAAGPDHDWSVELPEQPVIARADRNRVHQIVANLLANARTHTPAGTSVVTSLSVDGTHAVIRVSDNGPGIPASVRDTLFERFTRADTARARSATGTSSTGLGLAIVAAVVAAHRGTVAVASEPGHGSTFTVRLPLR